MAICQDYVAKHGANENNVQFQFFYKTKKEGQKKFKEGTIGIPDTFSRNFSLSELKSDEYFGDKMEVLDAAIPGSDPTKMELEHQAITRSFFVRVYQPAQGSCNTKETTKISIKSDDERLLFHCTQVYSRKGRCFYAALDHCGIAHGVKPKD